MPQKYFPIPKILSILSDDPVRIAETTTGLTSAHLRTPPAEHDWSVNEILAHLRACSDVWGGHILRILAEDTPTLIGVNPRTWIKKTNYLALDFAASFQAFTRQRSDLLNGLRTLKPDEWNRTASVHAWGQVYSKTLLGYADYLARHERIHVRQIEAAANAVRSNPGF